MNRLPQDIFLKVVKHAPLVSIDLIIEHEGEVLLGLRRNPPAQNFWFVPGGRILKGESFNAALTRLLRQETGLEPEATTISFRGIYQHFYHDCFCGTETSTHYVVIGMTVTLNRRPIDLPADQHSDYRWMPAMRIGLATDVHPNTQAYFPDANATGIRCWPPA